MAVYTEPATTASPFTDVSPLIRAAARMGHTRPQDVLTLVSVELGQRAHSSFYRPDERAYFAQARLALRQNRRDALRLASEIIHEQKILRSAVR